MATDSVARGMAGSALGKINNLPTAFKVKPSVATYNDLPLTGNEAGDVRQTRDDGQEYYWDGTQWEMFGANDAVRYTAQTLTEEQKAQARTNINAESVFRFSTMPTASATYNGMIVQYVGTTTTDYTNGYFYKCGESGGSYSWVQTNVQPSGGTTGDVLEIEYLTDGTKTLAELKTMLQEINTAGRHVMFDTSSLSAQMYLCTIYIDDYTNPTVFRVEDKVTGKLNIGAYDGTMTLSTILAGAVEDFVNIVVTCVTQDGVTVTGQTVTLREGTTATSPIYATKSYNGQPVTFVVPKGFVYFASVSDTLASHFAPTTSQGIATATTNVTLTYSDVSNITSYNAVAAAVNALPDPTVMIGLVEIADTWVDEGGTSYSDPSIVVAIQNVEDEEGQSHQAAIMMRKWAMKYDMQFDAQEKEVATGTYQSNTYYYRDNAGTITLLVEGTDYNVGDAITGTVYKNSVRDTTCNIVKYGYNNYKMSAIRQYLNSEVSEAGTWWTSMHTGDMPPSQLSTTRGYLVGCSTEFKNAIKPIKIQCNANTVTDSGRLETMYDKVWLPSGTQMYGSVNTDEGAYFPYVKSAMGVGAPTNSANAGRIYYSIANHSSAKYYWLRSATRSTSCSAWYGYPSGYLGYNTAYDSSAAVPAFAIF